MPSGSDAGDLIGGMLRALRAHLGFDVVFVSHLVDGQRVFRHVDAASDRSGVTVGQSDPAEDSYCHYVVCGQLPQFLHDAADHPLASALTVTRALPVGTHFSVPIVFADGTTYGTLCGFTHEVQPAAVEDDLAVVRMLAVMIAGFVEDAEAQRRQEAQRRDRLGTVAAGVDLHMLWQPIVDLHRGQTVGVEALARFPTLNQGPAAVFADAWRLGVGVELELKAIRYALAQLPHLPDGVYLSVNASPTTVACTGFLDVAADADGHHIVVEITEHAAVHDYQLLVAAVNKLHTAGVRLAIDDVGTGFSGLDHIVRLGPDILKVDGALVSGVDTSPAKQAMVAALMTFANRTGTAVVAERVETAAELDTLRVLGVPAGQGYHLGRPARPVDLTAADRSADDLCNLGEGGRGNPL